MSEVIDPLVLAGTSLQFWPSGRERKVDKGWSQDVWGSIPKLLTDTKEQGRLSLDTTSRGPESHH